MKKCSYYFVENYKGFDIYYDQNSDFYYYEHGVWFIRGSLNKLKQSIDKIFLEK